MTNLKDREFLSMKMHANCNLMHMHAIDTNFHQKIIGVLDFINCLVPEKIYTNRNYSKRRRSVWDHFVGFVHLVRAGVKVMVKLDLNKRNSINSIALFFENVR